METRGVTAATKPPEPKSAATGNVPRIKVKQPSYRSTLLRLSSSISHSSAEILQRYSKSEPSLTLHFHQQHWRFEQQDGVFLYNSQGRQILECIRNEQIPVDCLEVFRDVKIKFYEGCLILRLVDHRTTPANIIHTALRPSPESVWTELILISEHTQGQFTDAKALAVESDILVATNPPLDLRPAIHPAQVAQALASTRDPPLPRSKRRRGAQHDSERDRLLFLYDESHGRDFAPDFKRLAFVEAHRRKRATAGPRPGSVSLPGGSNTSGATATGAAAGSGLGLGRNHLRSLTPGSATSPAGSNARLNAIPANATPEESLAAQQQQVQQAMATAGRASASPAVKAMHPTPMSIQQQQQQLSQQHQQQQAALAAAAAAAASGNGGNGHSASTAMQQLHAQQKQQLQQQQHQQLQQQANLQGLHGANANAYALRQAQLQAAAKRHTGSPNVQRQGMTPQQMAQQLAMHQAQLQLQQQQQQQQHAAAAGNMPHPGGTGNVGTNPMFDDLARQQQVMLQQRAMAIRTLQAQNAARQHAAAQAAGHGGPGVAAGGSGGGMMGSSPSPGAMHARLPQSAGRSQTSSPAMRTANLQNGGGGAGSPALQQQQLLQQQMQIQAMQAAAAAAAAGQGGVRPGGGPPTALQMQQMRQAHLVQQQQMAFNNANAQAHSQAKAQQAAAMAQQQQQQQQQQHQNQQNQQGKQ